MAEAMTSESIVEAEWVLKKYWTKVRFAFQTKNGAWADVDVLAYNPESKHLVISESKVQGLKNHVYAYTLHTRRKHGSILAYDGDNYFSFLHHLPLLCEDEVVFSNFERMVKHLTVQLVCNYAITPEVASNAHSDIQKKIAKYRLPVSPDVQLDTTIEVIARIIMAERKSGQGRRYGHPVLDMAREINRYFFPCVRDAGHSPVDRARVKNESVASFLKAIGVDGVKDNN
jgi:hypothetical protein